MMTEREKIKIKEAMVHLLEANPNCTSEYLFEQISKAYAILEPLVKKPYMTGMTIDGS